MAFSKVVDPRVRELLLEMLSQKLRQAVSGKVRALPFTARCVVIDEPVLKIRFQDIVAQTVLYDPVTERERFDQAFLRVIDHKPVIAAHTVGLVFHLTDDLPQVP